MSATAIVIGGGVIGLSTAYQLARKRFGKVILVDKGPVGDGSSIRAAGIITGLLWSETGVLARKLALQLYRELSEELPGYRFQDVGCLNLFDAPSWPEREKLFPLYDRLNVAYEILSAAEMRQRWPELTPSADLIGLYDPLGGYSEPEEYIPALAQKIRELGVEIRENTPVTGFRQRNGRIAGVTTPTGVIEGDAVVSTVHVWTPTMVAQLGWQVPVKAFVHQRYVTAPLATAPHIPAVNANPQGGYIRPAAGGRLLAGGETAWREEHRVTSPDFHMSELSAPADVQSWLRTNMTSLFPNLAQVPWETEKVGLIAFSVDGEPMLGPVAGWPGLYLGCAFHSGGFAYNPVAGLLLAEFVADGQPQLDVSAFSPNRFTPQPVEEYLALTVTQGDAVRRRH
ncbi:MAG: FAD-binding oxidoreductase [Caldilineaceae bacterium]|nr:FAD-binding oxidoreductase [Caldilineaceae bacterium]